MPVATLLVYFSTPPLEILRKARINEAEKDNHNTKCKTGIESRTQSHGILAPPSVVAVFDNIIEDIADEHPDREVETRCRGYPRHGAKDDREVDLAQDA